MSDLEASFAMGTADNFVQRAQQYMDAMSTMGQRSQHVIGAFSSSLGQASSFIERLNAQFGSSQPQGEKTEQGKSGDGSKSAFASAIEQAGSVVDGLSHAVETASTVIDEVSNTAGEVKAFSSASVSAWQAITSNKSKTSGDYWRGVFSSVSDLYKEGKDVVTSAEAVVDTVLGKALDKGQEVQESTVSASPLSKDVLATNAGKALTEHGLSGGANNKDASAVSDVQRVFVVNMPESGVVAYNNTRDQSSNTSEPSWLDNIKSAVEIGQDILDLGKGVKDFRRGGAKGKSLLGLSEIVGLNESSGSKGHSSKGRLSSKGLSKPQTLLPHLLEGATTGTAVAETANTDFDQPKSPSKRLRVSKWAKGIKGNGVINAIAGSAELAEVWNGDASMKDKVKQSGGVVGSVVGSGLGTWGGAAAGAAIGSVVPVIGTAVGGLIGGVIGSMGGGALGESLGSQLVDSVSSWFSSDDEASSGPKAQHKQSAQRASDSVPEKSHGELKISVEDKRVTVSSVTAHNLDLSIAGSSMGGLS